MSRPIAPRTVEILRALMSGVSRELVRGRFGLSGNQLADITARHRVLLLTRGPLPVTFQLKLNETAAPEQRQARLGAAPGGPPPPPPVGSRILSLRRWFTRHTPWEEFELARVDLGPRQVLVPFGALVTGGDRAWRCEVVA